LVIGEAPIPTHTGPEVAATDPKSTGLRPPLVATTDDWRFVLVFVLSAAVTVAPFFGLLLRLVSLGEVLNDSAPAGEVRLYGPRYSDFATFKAAETYRRDPDIVVLGSSRVMQFRESMFTGCGPRPNCFYNAGGALPTIRAGNEFLRALGPDQAPRVLLLGLDIWHFDPNFDPRKHDDRQLRSSFQDQLGRAMSVTRDVAAQLLTDPEIRGIVIGSRLAPAGVRGINAILDGSGFRSDGSYRYGRDVLDRVASQASSVRSADELMRIATEGTRFEHFASADEASMAELQELIGHARRSNSTLIAFTPPFSDDVAAAIDAEPGLRAGFADVERRLAALFASQGVPFVAIRRFSDIGCGDSERFDGYHPTEVCNARLLLKLLQEPEIVGALAPYAAVDCSCWCSRCFASCSGSRAGFARGCSRC